MNLSSKLKILLSVGHWGCVNSNAGVTAEAFLRNIAVFTGGGALDFNKDIKMMWECRCIENVDWRELSLIGEGDFSYLVRLAVPPQG